MPLPQQYISDSMTVGNRLSDMEFDEISLVTRPANQLSKVVLFKSDTLEDHMSTETLEDTIDTDAQDDMEKGMGYGGKKRKMIAVEEMMDDEDMSEEDMDKMGMKRKMRKVRKDEDVIDLPAEVYEYIESLEAANAELLEQVEKMADYDDAASEDILKSADPAIVEIVKAAEARAAAAEQIAKAERDFRLEREFVSKAESFTHLPVKADEFGKVLKSAADVLSDSDFTALFTVLTAANDAVKNSGVFSEIGKNTVADSAATNEIDRAAARIMEQAPGLTKEQAIAKAVEADPSLYKMYLRGN